MSELNGVLSMNEICSRMLKHITRLSDDAEHIAIANGATSERAKEIGFHVLAMSMGACAVEHSPGLEVQNAPPPLTAQEWGWLKQLK